jgi:hypothetical protein
MKKVLTLLVALAVVGLFTLPAVAQQDADGTLYQQEGTASDGYGVIDATNRGPGGGVDSDSWTNWKYQYGGGTWSGVYRDDGWLEVSTSGDSEIDIECDIEMYYSEEFNYNKIYFHLGNIYTATQADREATVTGTFTSNNGMWIGISFDGTGKTESDLLVDGGGNYTGEVADAMVGTVDVLGRDISAESFNAKILLSSDAGTTWNPPDTFGTGASGTILNTLWWLVNGGAAGTHNVMWSIEMLPDTHQPDGNYNWDPAIVATPVL